MKNFYDFTLSKIVLLEEDSYTVGAYDLKDVSTYDLAKDDRCIFGRL